VLRRRTVIDCSFDNQAEKTMFSEKNGSSKMWIWSEQICGCHLKANGFLSPGEKISIIFLPAKHKF
jgi:hypothetical protein